MFVREPSRTLRRRRPIRRASACRSRTCASTASCRCRRRPSRARSCPASCRRGRGRAGGSTSTRWRWRCWRRSPPAGGACPTPVARRSRPSRSRRDGSRSAGAAAPTMGRRTAPRRMGRRSRRWWPRRPWPRATAAVAPELDEADGLLARGDHRGALDAYRRVLERAPDGPAATRVLEILVSSAAHLDEADELAGEILTRQPEAPLPLLVRAVAAAEHGEPALAADTYEQIATIARRRNEDEDVIIARLAAAEQWLRADKTDRAYRLTEQVLATMPAHAGGETARTLQILGDRLVAKGQIAEADRIFESRLALAGDGPDARSPVDRARAHAVAGGRRRARGAGGPAPGRARRGEPRRAGAARQSRRAAGQPRRRGAGARRAGSARAAGGRRDGGAPLRGARVRAAGADAPRSTPSQASNREPWKGSPTLPRRSRRRRACRALRPRSWSACWAPTRPTSPPPRRWPRSTRASPSRASAPRRCPICCGARWG